MSSDLKDSGHRLPGHLTNASCRVVVTNTVLPSCDWEVWQSAGRDSARPRGFRCVRSLGLVGPLLADAQLLCRRALLSKRHLSLGCLREIGGALGGY